MPKKPTKAMENVYCIKRCEAAEFDPELGSRESAAEKLCIERNRLARIELGTVDPNPDEVLLMSKAYNCPELCNIYCAETCPLGKGRVAKVTLDDFDRLSLRVLASLKDVNDIRDTIIAISEDGQVNNAELADFGRIMDALNKISDNARALAIWAEKNIEQAGAEGNK